MIKSNAALEELLRAKKYKINALIARVKELEEENKAKDIEISTLKNVATEPKQPTNFDIYEDETLMNFYRTFVLVVRELIQNDEIISPKLITKLNRQYRQVEVSVFKARVGELLQGQDEKRFLNYCFSWGYLQKIGSNLSTVIHRRVDEVDAGSPVRVYRLSAEIIQCVEEDLYGQYDGPTGDGVSCDC